MSSAYQILPMVLLLLGKFNNDKVFESFSSIWDREECKKTEKRLDRLEGVVEIKGSI